MWKPRGIRWYALPPTIRQILQDPHTSGSNITVSGHIKAIRKFKKIGFVDISDGSTFKNLPVVLTDTEAILNSHNLKVGQSISITGNLVESKGVQDFELAYDANNSSHSLNIIGDVEKMYPIQKKEMTLPYLRNHMTVRHRTSTLASILRLRSFLEAKFIEFFDRNNFVKVTPPMITSADCEGAGEQFKVEPINEKEGELFFGKPAYLTVSTQLHLEALAPSFNRVWTLTPCFRAEDSNTNRHLSEFWMLEAEISYVSEVKQLTDFTESMIRYVTQQLREQSEDTLKSRYSKDEQESIQSRWDTILSDTPWPSITYTKAIEIINKVKLKGRLKGRHSWGDSISTEDEKWLAGEHFKSPVFITDYPKVQKPFYMPDSPISADDKPTVSCYDLVFPVIGEVVGGSLREHNYEKLIAEMKSRGMKLEDMTWYLSIRLNGSVPHGGFGMGFERLILYLSALDNLRDVVTFPRTPELCDC